LGIEGSIFDIEGKPIALKSMCAHRKQNPQNIQKIARVVLANKLYNKIA